MEMTKFLAAALGRLQAWVMVCTRDSASDRFFCVFIHPTLVVCWLPAVKHSPTSFILEIET